MRQIKFRVWDKHDHDWYKRDNPPQRMTYFANPVVYDDGWLQFESVGQTPIGDSGQDRFVIMQYTGLFDKLGKEIYEGDIVLCGYFSPIGQLETVKLVQIVDGETEPFNSRWGISGLPEKQYSLKQSEIIGNIYENPELL